MAYVDELISTGVDQLINVVFNKKRIKLEDVANELGISQNVILEWVKILEDEGLIKTEYFFTTPFLVWTGQDFKEPEGIKDVKSERDVLIDEIEGLINKVTGELKSVKDNKRKLKVLMNEISSFDVNVSKVSTNLNKIRKDVTKNSTSINELITKIDEDSKEFTTKHSEYKTKLKSISTSSKEDSTKIKSLIKNYESHKTKLDGVLLKLNNEVENLNERIGELNEISSDIDGKIETYKALETSFNSNIIEKFISDFNAVETEYDTIKKNINDRLTEMKDALSSIESFTLTIDELEEKLSEDTVTKRYSEINNLFDMLGGLEKEEEQIGKKMNALLTQLKNLKIEVSPLTNEKAAKIVRESKGKIKSTKREYTAVEQKKKELLDLVKQIKDDK